MTNTRRHLPAKKRNQNLRPKIPFEGHGRMFRRMQTVVEIRVTVKTGRFADLISDYEGMLQVGMLEGIARTVEGKLASDAIDAMRRLYGRPGLDSDSRAEVLQSIKNVADLAKSKKTQRHAERVLIQLGHSSDGAN